MLYDTALIVAFFSFIGWMQGSRRVTPGQVHIDPSPLIGGQSGHHLKRIKGTSSRVEEPSTHIGAQTDRGGK